MKDSSLTGADVKNKSLTGATCTATSPFGEVRFRCGKGDNAESWDLGFVRLSLLEVGSVGGP